MNQPANDPHETTLEARLQRLDFGRPDPDLRHRTLRDVAQVLALKRRQPTRTLGVVATAGALAVLCLLVLSRPQTTETPTPTIDPTTIAQWLDLDHHVARHVASRLAKARPPRPHATSPSNYGSSSHGSDIFLVDRL